MKDLKARDYRVARRLANYHVKVRTYTGPFDVLLQLVAEQKVSVEELDLSKLTEDYLIFLKTNIDEGIRLAPEFIQVASLLILIKTSSLLGEVAEVNGEAYELPLSENELKKSLKELEFAKKVQLLLQQRFENYSYRLKARAALNNGFKFQRTVEIDIQKLIAAYMDIVERSPVSVKDRFVSNRVFEIRKFEKMLTDFLEKKGSLSFFSMAFELLEDKKQIVSLFLAALRLSMDGKIEMYQSNDFGDIEIIRTS